MAVLAAVLRLLLLMSGAAAVLEGILVMVVTQISFLY
jgi:hypothetical protein